MRRVAAPLLAAALTAALTASARAETRLVVGEAAIGAPLWEIGVAYAPLDATVGDKLFFEYATGLHDVWLLPAAACDFSAPGARELSPSTASNYTHSLDAPGTFAFACSLSKHCNAGMLLTVSVAPVGAPAGGSAAPAGEPAAPTPGGGRAAAAAAAVDLPLPGLVAWDGAEGACGPPAAAAFDGFGPGAVTVACRSPALTLAPGDNVFPSVPLPNPYPPERVLLLQAAATVVDVEAGQPAPQDVLYLHHFFGDMRFLPIESRNAPMGRPLPPPHALALDGALFADPAARFANLHFIRTEGVAGGARKRCVECWCTPVVNASAPLGGMGCCARCEGAPAGPPRRFALQFNVTYQPEEAIEFDVATLVGLDVYGGIEFNVAAEGPGKTFNFSRVMAADHFCPQPADFGLLRCWAHEHAGGLGMRVTDAVTGASICESFPIYGADGFLERFTVQEHAPPLRLRPDQPLRFEFAYDASQPYAGVMAHFWPVFSDFNTSTCPALIDFRGIIQPPAKAAAGAAGARAAEAEPLDAALAEGAVLVGAVSAVPADCGGATDFVTGTLEPCLPLLLANLTGAPAVPADATACCAGGAGAGGDVASAMIDALDSAGGRAECVCPLGAAARALSQSPRLVLALRTIDETCSPGNPPPIFAAFSVSGVFNIGVTGIFAPLCPELAEVSGDGVSGVSAMDSASAMG